MKTCKRCGETKPFAAFSRCKKATDGHQTYCKQCKNEYNRDTGRQTLPTIRVRARNQGVPFDLTEETLPPIPEVCPVLGTPLKRTLGYANDNSPSLDRLIPEKGYVPGNVVWVSFRANRIKNDATYEELQRVTRWVGEQLRQAHSV